jgi:hypothetical protein
MKPLFEDSLRLAGLNTSTARFDGGMLTMFRQGEFTTPLYNVLHQNPWEVHRFGEVRMKDSLASATKPGMLFSQLSGQVGFGTRRSLLGNPIQYAIDFGKRPGALNAVLNQMRKDGMIKGSVPTLAGVPEGIQQAAATVLTVAIKSVELRRLCFVDIQDPKRLFGLMAKNNVSDTDYTTQLELSRSYRKLNMNYLGAAAQDIALAVEAANEILSTVPDSARYSFRVRTNWGLIRLNGAGDDGYDDEPNLLTIDTGGDDTYLNSPSTVSVENWVSVVIDTHGNDRYLSDRELRNTEVAKYSGRKSGDRPGPAGAVMGVAILMDTKGNDLYRSHRPGLGAGATGFGALIDLSGNDTYDAYEDAQGFGFMGVGVLSDIDGSDTYRGFSRVQGVGSTNGIGLLCDVNGDDNYIANDEVIDFPSAQTTQHNLSMAQGTGVGRRADYLDGMSYAGGIGLLVDGAGSDTYSCGVFGQGTGYWMGVGMLLDKEGQDSYLGYWYVQGASAHFAVGYLFDGQGNDTYNASMNMAQGAGHDFGTGALLDEQGDDIHKAPNLSLGAGNANGIGWFVDRSGNDRYEADGIALGRAAETPVGTLREFGMSLGLFFDGAGNDTYVTSAGYASNNSSKSNRVGTETDPTRAQTGIFVDR